MKTAQFNKYSLVAGALFTAISFSAMQPAAAETRSELGVLKCTTIKGTRINLIIHSTVDVKCVFDDGKSTETYVGETGIGLGIDINIKKDAVIAYSVFGLTGAKAGMHSLAGKYGGAKAAATVGVGLGAAVLVGGDNDNFALQPLALEASTGLGAEAGLTYLNLEKSQ